MSDFPTNDDGSIDWLEIRQLVRGHVYTPPQEPADFTWPWEDVLPVLQAIQGPKILTDNDVYDLISYITGFEIRENEDGEGFMVFEDMGSDTALHGPYRNRHFASEAMLEKQLQGVRTYTSPERPKS